MAASMGRDLRPPLTAARAQVRAAAHAARSSGNVPAAPAAQSLPFTGVGLAQARINLDVDAGTPAQGLGGRPGPRGRCSRSGPGAAPPAERRRTRPGRARPRPATRRSAPGTAWRRSTRSDHGRHRTSRRDITPRPRCRSPAARSPGSPATAGQGRRTGAHRNAGRAPRSPRSRAAPSARSAPLAAHGIDVDGIRGLLDGIDDRLHLAVVARRAQEEDIGDGQLLADVDGDDVVGLLVRRCGRWQAHEVEGAFRCSHRPEDVIPALADAEADCPGDAADGSQQGPSTQG